MRLYILRTLLHKELLRLLNNRGGLAMAGVIVVAAVLAAAFGDRELQLASGSTQYIVDHWGEEGEERGWLAHLRASVPEELAEQIRFRGPEERGGKVVGYPRRSAGIQLRRVPASPTDETGAFKVWVWYADREGASAAPFESWFWHETHRYFEQRGGILSDGTGITATGQGAAPWAESHRRFVERWSKTKSGEASVPRIVEVERSRLRSRRVNLRAGAAMFLVLMALCFVCIFLMPSATAEERERGALLAQALSPASSLEILGAKLLFYPSLAVLLASTVTGICQPKALQLPFFWLALGITALGTVGIGLTLSVLARTQRAASMSALSYMLAVALLLLISRANGLTFPAVVMIENHGPRMLLAALDGAVTPGHWGQLAISWVLAVVWCGLATGLFRRFGWQ